MTYLMCRVAWMESYASRDEPRFSHHRYIKEGNTPYEAVNFSRGSDGYYRGYVPVGSDAIGKYGRINIDKLGAMSRDTEVSGITVVFCAPHRTEGGLRIVGFYKNAVVLREPMVGRDDMGNETITRVLSKEAVLIPDEDRVFSIPGSREGGFGQANLWYGLNEPSHEALRKEVEAYICNQSALPEAQRTVNEFRLRKLHMKWEGRTCIRHFIYAKGFCCQACGYKIRAEEIEVWGSGFELHHLQPWAELKEGASRSVSEEDFAVLCAVCHRAIHKTPFVSDVPKFREVVRRAKR